MGELGYLRVGRRGSSLRPADFALCSFGGRALPCGRRRRCPVVGPWWLPREVVLMVQRSDFVRKKIDFSESCTTKRWRTAVGCCNLVDASRGSLQVCSPGAREPAPTGVQALGQAALRSPLPLAHTHRARPRAETGRARRRRARRGSGGRCGGVSVGSERARERAQTPRGGCARRPAWRAKGYFRRQREAGRGR